MKVSRSSKAAARRQGNAPMACDARSPLYLTSHYVLLFNRSIHSQWRQTIVVTPFPLSRLLPLEAIGDLDWLQHFLIHAAEFPPFLLLILGHLGCSRFPKSIIYHISYWCSLRFAYCDAITLMTSKHLKTLCLLSKQQYLQHPPKTIRETLHAISYSLHAPWLSCSSFLTHHFLMEFLELSRLYEPHGMNTDF